MKVYTSYFEILKRFVDGESVIIICDYAHNADKEWQSIYAQLIEIFKADANGKYYLANRACRTFDFHNGGKVQVILKDEKYLRGLNGCVFVRSSVYFNQHQKELTDFIEVGAKK